MLETQEETGGYMFEQGKEVMTHTSTEQERAILYKGFCEWCKTVPHLDLDPRLHTHGGRIEDGGYIADTATAKAFADWKAARCVQPAEVAPMKEG